MPIKKSSKKPLPDADDDTEAARPGRSKRSTAGRGGHAHQLLLVEAALSRPQKKKPNDQHPSDGSLPVNPMAPAALKVTRRKVCRVHILEFLTYNNVYHQDQGSDSITSKPAPKFKAAKEDDRFGFKDPKYVLHRIRILEKRYFQGQAGLPPRDQYRQRLSLTKSFAL